MQPTVSRLASGRCRRCISPPWAGRRAFRGPRRRDRRARHDHPCRPTVRGVRRRVGRDDRDQRGCAMSPLNSGGGRDDQVDATVQPDPCAMRAHLNRLFRRVPHEYPGGLIEIAWSDPDGAIRSANTFPATPEGSRRPSLAPKNGTRADFAAMCTSASTHESPAARHSAGPVRMTWRSRSSISPTQTKPQHPIGSWKRP